MGILGTIVIGLLVGLLARLLTPGSGPTGIIVTMLLGIGGAFVATFVGQTMGWYEIGQTAGFIGALIGAMALVFVYREIVRRRD